MSEGLETRLASQSGMREKDLASLALIDPATMGSYVTWEDVERVWLPALTTSTAAELLWDKIRFHEHVSRVGLTVPALIAVHHAQDDPSRVESELARRSPAGAVIKPAAGGKGRGTVVFTSIEPGGAAGTTVRGRRRPVRGAIRQSCAAKGGSRVMVQELLRQHRALDDYAPQPLSTTRVFTLLRRNGSVRTLGAFLRLGRAGAMTDNVTGGGMAVDIDVTSGRLGRGAIVTPEGLTEQSRHPDRGAAFGGQRLPHWEETLALARSAARLFDGVRLAGWDVMITDDGPKLIEGNWNVRLHTLQALRGAGLLDEGLGVDLRELGVPVTPDADRRHGPLWGTH